LSSRSIAGAGVILIVVLATLIAVFNAVACKATVSDKIVKPPSRPPELGS
jgi:hypothetical protein